MCEVFFFLLKGQCLFVNFFFTHLHTSHPRTVSLTRTEADVRFDLDFKHMSGGFAYHIEINRNQQPPAGELNVQKR